MEEINVIWGKFWTYLVVCLIVLFGGVIAFYLSEQKRDADAATFYDAGRVNNEQWIDIVKYAYDNDNISKDSLIYYLSKIKLIRTRAEMEIIQQKELAADLANDNNYQVLIDTVCFDVIIDSLEVGKCFVNSGYNEWDISDVTSTFDEQKKTRIWGSTGGAKLAITDDDSNGKYGLLIRPGSAEKSFAMTRMIIDPTFAHEIYIDVKQGSGAGYLQLLDFDGDSIYTEIKKFNLAGSGLQTYRKRISPGKKYISVAAGWDSGKPGNSLIVDNIRLYRYELLN